MYRSILLRGFDQDISKKIGSYMTNKGVRFIPESIPDSIEKVNEKIIVSYKNKKEEFDTVMLAIGREAVTNYLNLDSIGLKTNKKNKKIIVSEDESTNISNIFAIGDCAENRPELTPPAIKAGRLLVNRLFNNERKIMNYKNIATTVFTPLEYGCIGYNEEEAISKFKDISVYHSEFTPLEWNLNLDNTETSYCKILCNDNDKGRIVGMHLLSPNAGEIIQGFSSAFNLGITKDDLNDTVAIHPTIAEELVLINKNKKDNDSKKDGC